jgi:hypothetical protein
MDTYIKYTSIVMVMKIRVYVHARKTNTGGCTQIFACIHSHLYVHLHSYDIRLYLSVSIHL